MKKFLISIFAMVFVGAATAGYVRTGEAKASVCAGFVIKSCSMKKLAAIETGGQLYEFAEKFDSVSEFSGKNCFIRTDSNDPIRFLTNVLTLPTFYTESDGELKKISPDYIVFQCRKQ